MFGLDDILLASLIGGGLGAITSKKKPLQGALLGAGLGAGGAALMPAAAATGAAQGGLLGAGTTGAGMGGSGSGLMFGGAGTAGAGMGGSGAGMSFGASTAGAGMDGAGSGLLVDVGASTPLASYSPSMLQTALGTMKQAKPYADAIGTGVQVANSFKEEPYPQIQGQPLPPRQQNWEFMNNQPHDYQADAERRKQMYAQFVRNMRG